MFGPASGNKAVGAAKSRGESYERADRDHKPRVAPLEAADPHPDPETLPHPDYPALAVGVTAIADRR
jgi:hypothetical protein